MYPTRRRYSRFAFGLIFSLPLAGFSSGTVSAEYLIGNRIFGVSPEAPSIFHPPFLTVLGDICSRMSFNEASVDSDSKTVSVSLTEQFLDITPCPPPNSSLYAFPIEGISATGDYQFDIYFESSSPPSGFFDPSNYEGSFALAIEETGPRYWVETPAKGSPQGGIGIVRGWACDAESVEVQFDFLPLQKVAYGTTRTDTNVVCGDENNGYGFVVGWGNLGLGTHRMRTYIDRVEVADVEFDVVGLDEPFIRGLSGNYVLEDFPETGQSVTIQWSEEYQNFIIIEQSP